MNVLRFHLPGLACLILASCEPKEQALWSPDGSRAAILSNHRLALVGEDGALSEPRPDRDGEGGTLWVEGFAWLGDSSGVIVHRVRLSKKWDELAPLLSPSDVDRIQSLAARMPDLLRSAVVLHGDADSPAKLLESLGAGEALAMSNALYLAVENEPEEVRSALEGAPRALGALDTGKGEFAHALHELALLKPDEEGTGKVLIRDLSNTVQLRSSPRHPYFARSVETGEDGLHRLELVSLVDGKSVTVADETSRSFEWTPDGRALVLMKPVTEGDGGLVGIERREVIREDGEVFDPVMSGTATDLAFAVVPFAPRLAVLPDGSVLFASHALTLPMNPDETPEEPRLYRVPADGGAPSMIPTEPGALPTDLGHFVASPDGKRIAVVESGTDAVALIDLASGKSELIVSPNPGWKTRLLPSWRNAKEFTFAIGDPDSKRVRWMLWSEGKATELSVGWPEPITKEWMEFKGGNP